VQDAAGIIRSSTLVGATVLDRQGQKLGQIENVLLDTQTGQATFVVIEAKAPGPSPAMQYLVPPLPCWTRDSGWTHEMEEFSQE
jgi:sporulation protein YlmC with PRC-barrel domain